MFTSSPTASRRAVARATTRATLAGGSEWPYSPVAFIFTAR